jgi:hypothetical protein
MRDRNPKAEFSNEFSHSLLDFRDSILRVGQSMKSACGENSAKYIGIMLD